MIVNADCRIAMEFLPDDSVDCIVTDPPYGETSLGWDHRVEGWLTEARRVLKPSGSMWVFGSLRMLCQTYHEFDGWNLAQDIVWEKHNGAGFSNDRFRRVHELAVQFYRSDTKWSEVYKAPQFTADATARTVRRKAKPAHWTGARGPSYYVSEDGGPRLMRSVIQVRSEHGRAVHPTQKPEGIVEPLLLYSCPPGGLILDPFAGSGTTGLVAAKHGRRFWMIEARPDYAAVAKARISAAVIEPVAPNEWAVAVDN